MTSGQWSKAVSASLNPGPELARNYKNNSPKKQTFPESDELPQNKNGIRYTKKSLELGEGIYDLVSRNVDKIKLRTTADISPLWRTLLAETDHMGNGHLMCPRTEGLWINDFYEFGFENLETRSLLDILCSEPLGRGKKSQKLWRFPAPNGKSSILTPILLVNSGWFCVYMQCVYTKCKI